MSDDTILTIFFFALCGASVWGWRRHKRGKPAFCVGSGTYTVGKDIPPGTFNLVAQSGSGEFCILERKATQWSHAHPLGFESPNVAARFRNVTLKRGDILEINGSLWITTQSPTPIRDVQEEVLEPGNYKIGLDILPGTYNLEAVQGIGSVFNDVPEEEGQLFFQEMGVAGEGIASRYLHLRCEEGTTLYVRGSLHLQLSPPRKPPRWRWLT